MSEKKELLPILQDRCTGHCCESFYLPYSPQVFKKKLQLERLMLKEYKAGKITTFKNIDDEVDWLKSLMDNIEIFTMIRFKRVYTMFELSKIKRLLGKKWKQAVKSQSIVHHYTCKHYDKANGNCMNYENRPYMCRTFPNTSVKNNDGSVVRYCEYKDCTCKTWNLDHLIKTKKIKV